MNKLKKSTLPIEHTKDNFKCFGPPATKDGEFSDTMLCDMGCFKQGKIDSNKFYHAAIVQSKINDEWYVYFEYGRTGSSTNPQFQFLECVSQNEAKFHYEKQLHAKNDKRGMWIEHSTLGRILQPKPKKDCYLVRPQTTRNTGLPDAKTITINNSTQIISKNHNVKIFDKESTKLLNDLNIGTLQYTHSSLVDDVLPTIEAIEECRLVCDEATKICNDLQTDNKILESLDLDDLTRLVYGRIPKKKGKKEIKADWLLTPTNIQLWRDDLDVFENTLKTQSTTVSSLEQNYPFNLLYIELPSNLGMFLINWFYKATRNKHSYLKDDIRIKNMWEVEQPQFVNRFIKKQKEIKKIGKDKPLHQIVRKDLQSNEKEEYQRSGTWMLFHGTKSVCIAGILNESLRLPKQLSNISITGRMFSTNMGIYIADDFKKSIGYTSYKGSYWNRGSGNIKNRGAFIFICDVVLGNMFIPSGPKAFLNPPTGYDSIFGKAGNSGVMNNEFVVFDSNHINLRYLLEIK